MWPHRRSSSLPFRKWWVDFRSYTGQMFRKTYNQIINWRQDNPHSFGNEVKHRNPQTTSSGKFKPTCHRFAWYGSDDLRGKIGPPSCRQWKPSNYLGVRQLNCDKIIDKVDDEQNWVDPGVWSGGRRDPCIGNVNDDGDSGVNRQGGDIGTG